MEAQKCFLVLALACWFLLLARADYTLEVRAHSYENSDHLLANGVCCERELSGSTTDCISIFCGYGLCECDNKFVFCLRSADHAQDGDSDDCLGRCVEN